MSLSFIGSILKNIRQQDACSTKCIVGVLPKEDMDEDNETPQGKRWGQFIDIEKMRNKYTQTPYIKGSLYNIPVRIPSLEQNDKQVIDRKITSRKSFTTLNDTGLNYSFGSSSHLSFNSVDSDSQSKNLSEFSMFQITVIYTLEMISKWYTFTKTKVSVSSFQTSSSRNRFDLLDFINGLINTKTIPYLIIGALFASGFIITSV